jgi:hypothetical protein
MLRSTRELRIVSRVVERWIVVTDRVVSRDRDGVDQGLLRPAVVCRDVVNRECRTGNGADLARC